MAPSAAAASVVDTDSTAIYYQNRSPHTQQLLAKLLCMERAAEPFIVLDVLHWDVIGPAPGLLEWAEPGDKATAGRVINTLDSMLQQAEGEAWNAMTALLQRADIVPAARVDSGMGSFEGSFVIQWLQSRKRSWNSNIPSFPSGPWPLRLSLSHGEGSDETPCCQGVAGIYCRIECPIPDINKPPHRRQTGNSYRVGDVVTYSCDACTLRQVNYLFAIPLYPAAAPRPALAPAPIIIYHPPIIDWGPLPKRESRRAAELAKRRREEAGRRREEAGRDHERRFSWGEMTRGAAGITDADLTREVGVQVGRPLVHYLPDIPLYPAAAPRPPLAPAPIIIYHPPIVDWVPLPKRESRRAAELAKRRREEAELLWAERGNDAVAKDHGLFQLLATLALIGLWQGVCDVKRRIMLNQPQYVLTVCKDWEGNARCCQGIAGIHCKAEGKTDNPLDSGHISCPNPDANKPPHRRQTGKSLCTRERLLTTGMWATERASHRSRPSQIDSIRDWDLRQQSWNSFVRSFSSGQWPLRLSPSRKNTQRTTEQRG
ncbi:unnamed protein product [Vitrella brassicaformis CCMP3155]|uniref:Uncharacterized protein n=1 Tax=Vitrella brassicaformis (strain CCMP3155) TaxID=1169540 RepID=A0A0G4FZ84_VITBC|nr:unnamed protein product [Vitrella brassicaformis CCMP3155]|eukprot:CEM20399.1 unnamed protein product [Vitrella brassicaformis CCMP3155]